MNYQEGIGIVVDDYIRNMSRRQAVYLAGELLKAAWNPGWRYTPEEPTTVREGTPDYLPLNLHLEEGTPSGDLIPSLVEALYQEYLRHHQGRVRGREFCQQKLPGLIKEYFPYLMTHATAIKRLEKICNELNWEFSDFTNAPGIRLGDNGPGGSLEKEPVGQSPVWRELLELAARAAWSKAPILLTGETGTGKEVVARFIHEHSPRAKGPFVPVNCGAVPENLLESELFGYRKGAFSEARKDKPGLVEGAHLGTLFLDEISEMSTQLQVKLLRFTQEHTVLPLGALKEIHVEARIVAASNRDLEQEMDLGAFRPDLYYRLNVFRFTVPPLRNRSEDIYSLTRHFLRIYNQANETRVVGISPEVMEVFKRYQWPGNVRELENVVHRAVVLARSGDIRVGHLPEELSDLSPDGRVLLENSQDQVGLINDISRALTFSAREGGKPRRLGASLSVQYLADYFNLVGDRYFRPGDFADYISISDRARRRDKLANQIISALVRSGILEHNGGKAQASRYRLTIGYFSDSSSEGRD